jgi:hypothetical protein
MSGGSVPCSESFTFHVSPITLRRARRLLRAGLSPSSLCVVAALREIFSLFAEAGGAAVDQEHG